MRTVCHTSDILLLVALSAPWCIAEGQPLTPPSPSLATRTEVMQYVHEQWTVRDGLPVNNLNDLVQTRDGYLWIATWDGLVRFDGARFIVFNVGNTDGLPSNRILHLFESQDGTLWIATVEPAAVVQYSAGRFVEVPGSWKVFIDWFYELGEDLYLIDNDQRAYRYQPGGEPAFVPFLPDEKVRGILKSRSGVLWAAGDHGLNRLEAGGLTRFTVKDGLADDSLLALAQDANGALWMASVTGLDRYDDGGITRIPVQGGAWQGIDPRIHIGADSTLWISTEEAIYRQRRGRMFRAGEEDEGPWIAVRDRLFRGGRPVFHAPSNITVHLVDHEGGIWIATATSGLYRLKPAAVRTVGEEEGLGGSMTAVFEDRAGALWFAGVQGRPPSPPILVRLEDGLFTTYTRLPYTFWLNEDAEGSLWLGTYDGPRRLDRETGLLFDAPDDPLATALYDDQDGARWFILDGGGVYREQDGIRTFFGAEVGFPNETVQSVRETSDGALWFITAAGLLRYHDGRFVPFTSANGLSGDVVRGFYEDADGVLWVGTYGRGLNRIDLSTGSGQDGTSDLSEARVTTYRVRDGLHDDVIHVILGDDFGRLWMSTNRGLFWVSRDELNAFAEGRIGRVRSTSYDERDGMRNREANGGGHLPGIRDRQGRFWFPTQEGVVMVAPSRIQPSPVPPPIVIERVVAGDSARAARAEPVRLAATQRDFEIDYTALSFMNPEQVRFRYRLEGFDDDWRDVNRRTAFYTQVPPGTYTFRVTAANKDGVWNETGAALTLIVAPFFYETGWFYALCGIALLLLGWTGYRMRTRHVRLRQQVLETLVDERTEELRAEKAKTEAQAKKLRELDEAKSRFFANITHEFRTPLTLIIGPLKSALADGYGPTAALLQDAHRMMLRNSQRLLHLINQILDLAKAEVGHLTLDAQVQDLSGFVAQTVQAFVPLAERQRIHLACEGPETPVTAVFDQAQLEKVLLNLLSNALKFTDEGGAVRVTLRRVEPHAEIAVRDTGIGIAPEKLLHLFERFYQADASATRTHEGTGIGLALAKELIELHGGTITVESTPGVGSTFTVRLPLASPEFAVHAGSEDDRAEEAAPMQGAGAAVQGTAEVSLGRVGESPSAYSADEEDRTTVLVVDDNADVRAFVRSILEPAYRVYGAADGAEGLDQAKAALPDLIVSDVMMPRMDGFALSRALKEDPDTDCIPVILLTARADTEGELEGLETGADDYVTKPFEAEVLRARVAGLIATRQRLRERFSRERPPAEPALTHRSAFEQRLRGIVEAHMTDPAFNPEALASEAALSYSQLYRRLRDKLDDSPSLFIRRVRVEHAARLLAEQAGTISEVAYAVGFNSLSYFNRAFREYYDMAPSAYLRSGT